VLTAPAYLSGADMEIVGAIREAFYKRMKPEIESLVLQHARDIADDGLRDVYFKHYADFLRPIGSPKAKDAFKAIDFANKKIGSARVAA